MSTLSRKQREIQEREAQILRLSREMLLEHGYHGLNMDRIAERLEYSKGTIYNHFPCKEEIILALAIETTNRRTALFDRAAAFRGSTRERLMALGMGAELFVQLHHDHFAVEQTIRNSSIWDKTSEKRRVVMRSCEHRCVGIVAGIVRDAIACGDLVLEGRPPEDLVFGLWSLTNGAYNIIATSDPLAELGISEPFSTVRWNITQLVDGCGWRPHSREIDVEAVQQRVREEVFADEWRQLTS